jgi:hypothetical protein
MIDTGFRLTRSVSRRVMAEQEIFLAGLPAATEPAEESMRLLMMVAMLASACSLYTGDGSGGNSNTAKPDAQSYPADAACFALSDGGSAGGWYCPGVDAGWPPGVDAGWPFGVDAGWPGVDAGGSGWPPGVDAGLPPSDAGEPPPDAGEHHHHHHHHHHHGDVDDNGGDDTTDGNADD